MITAVAVIAVAVCLLSVMINIALLGLNLKLYTEWFKDQAITRRSQS